MAFFIKSSGSLGHHWNSMQILSPAQGMCNQAGMDAINGYGVIFENSPL